ncbi:MAG: cytochrome c [Rhodospirillaceae bacterium]|jgi:mono/diheme cytochrome c family protein|nr:cytochrome c [Rhodospirillaceae bacterium]MBT6360982.1 cytochrome c [Rhodospirillaceae bacterium]
MLPSTKIKLRSFTRLILCLAAAFIIAKVTISATSAASSDGRELYLKYCAACHGADLKGQPNWRAQKPDGTRPAPPHDETGHTWHHPDQLLFDYTKFGGKALYPKANSAMPGFKDSLSDQQIWGVLNYIKSRWPEQIRKRHKMMNQRSR